MKKNNQILNFAKSHKVITGIICYVIIAIIVVGILNIGKSKNSDTNEANTSETSVSTNEEQNNTNSQNQQETTEDGHSYLDALRKCTVMEAADIYTTGIGKKSDNAFNDARVTCDSWYLDWGEDDFFDAVYTDWENRKTEQVDGQPLTYYLDVLGW